MVSVFFFKVSRKVRWQMSYILEKHGLLMAFREGRQNALEEVYQAYSNGVAAFLKGGFAFKSRGEVFTFKGYRSPSDLQDALQETFCRAFSREARLAYDGLHPYHPYLLTIARNLTIDHFRRHVREVYEPVSGQKNRILALENAEPQGKSPEEQLLSREISTLVQTFYEELNETEKQILKVYFLSEDGQRQAARTLSMTRHQLRKAIARIRKRLQMRLTLEGYLEKQHSRQMKSVMVLLGAISMR